MQKQLAWLTGREYEGGNARQQAPQGKREATVTIGGLAVQHGASGR
ncbi:hypothetical protein [Brevibacillus sp. SAFN-007a]